MNDDTMNTTGSRCFQINRGDLGPIFRLLHLECRTLSPCAGIDESAAPITDATELTTLALDPALARAVAVLAAPDLKVDCVIGGGSSGLGYISVCRRRDIDSRGAVALVPAFGDAFLVHCFDDTTVAADWLARTLNTLPEFLAWDPATLSSIVMRPEMPDDLPEKMPLETLIYLLHSIDMYRATVYQNLLQHTPVDSDLRISAADFDAALSRAVTSGDIRWLLPAFQRLMPALRNCDLAPQAEHIEMLSRCNVIKPVRTSGPGPAAYLFGSTGARLGLEFYRSWHGAVGISIERTAGLLPPSYFLAPTAFANHMFTLECGAGNRGAVSYRAQTDTQLAESLRLILETPPASLPTAATPVSATAATSAATASIACLVCEKQNAIGAVFCIACGVRLDNESSPPAKPNCSCCRHPLEPGMKFCANCGEPAGTQVPPAAAQQSSPLYATPLNPVTGLCATHPAAGDCVVCGKDGRVVAASQYTIAEDSAVEGDDDRVDADMVALFLKRPDRHESEDVMLARWKHLQYCVRCQHAWLDNTSAEPVEIVDVDALLKS
jgi:hypothetical protein